MNGGLAMRSTRLRTVLIVLVGGGMLLSLYLLTSSQYHLKDVRHLLDTCQQQKDSLLAQLQVVYEQKNRVEKYLQQEKLEHKKTQDDNQKNNYLRLQVQKAKAEVDTKLSDLQKEQLSLQDRYHELESQTKELQEQQTQNEEKQTKMQADFKQTLRNKEEENALLHGNLSHMLQENEGLENQVGQLNNNIQQMKMEFFHYKKMYVEINQRLKRLTEQNSANAVAARADSGPAAAAPELGAAGKHDQHSLHTNQPHLEHQQGHYAGGMAQHNGNTDHRHPLPAPNIVSPRVTEAGKPASPQQPGAEAAAGRRESNVEEGPAAGTGEGLAQPPPPPSGLRQQLQPPDFGQPPAQHEEVSSMKGVSPSQLAGENQPLLPPPPPSQDSKQAPEVPQLEPAPKGPHQGEPPRLSPVVQSQEQKDQDTMVRKHVLEQQEGHPPGGGGGGGLLNQDQRGHDNMFMGMGGLPPWNPFGELARQQQQQIKSPDLKPRPNIISNNNNNRRQEEDENYPEDADDDNAEEQDDTQRDKNLKAFQDHDFEDNDGNDHNQAKEEGIVIAPK